MIFDFRVFLGTSYNHRRLSVEDLLSMMDVLSIETALVIPFKPVSLDVNQESIRLAKQVRAYQDRLLIAARIDPWQPNASSWFREAIETAGARALFLHPWEENFQVDLEIVDALINEAIHFKVPVLIMSGYPWVSEALQISTLAERWPEVPIVMSNGGQINISGLGQADSLLALRKNSNLYIDTAGIYRQDFIEEVVEELGSERVLFASNTPYYDQEYELSRIQFAKVTDKDRLAMAYGNAMRVLGVDDP
jgi:predicted TIM-barrel fold metal-dependent hydrolase